MSDPDQDTGAEGPATEGAEAPATRYGMPLTESRGQTVLHPSRDQLVDLVRNLRDHEGSLVCVAVPAADYLAYGGRRDLPEGIEPGRYEVVFGLLSHATAQRLRL